MRGEHWLNQLLYLDMKTFLPCLNLAYTDKMSMAASTEVRVPLLDDELVALAARDPAGPEAATACTRKYVFKRSMEGMLPEEVIWRPEGRLRRADPLLARRRPAADGRRPALARRPCGARGLLDPRGGRSGIVAADRAGTEDNALRIWALLTLELWQQTHLDRPSPAAADARRGVS